MYVNETTRGNITAEVLLDSINSKGVRLTTLVVQIPRIVLAEFNTHRKLSRNSASSRAIPFEKMVNNVIHNPFIPMAVQKTHKGMQGTEYIDEEAYNEFKDIWLSNLDDAVAGAVCLNEQKVTKQITNRLLEPFLYHKILVTSTSFDNFMALRNHEAAEIHIAEAALKLTIAMNNSVPRYMNQWGMHLPFIIDSEVQDYLNSEHYQEVQTELEVLQATHDFDQFPLSDIYLALISAGKCAKVSYNNFDGIADHKADYSLAVKLITSGHWSPMEHIGINTPTINNITSNFCASWTQFRSLFKNQNLIDNRLRKY